MNENPKALLVAKGSTPARTRLYQIGIANFFHQISETFEIQGYITDVWEPFKRGKSYEAFLLKHK